MSAGFPQVTSLLERRNIFYTAVVFLLMLISSAAKGGIEEELQRMKNLLFSTFEGINNVAWLLVVLVLVGTIGN
jgi:hypothetical protein